MSPSKYVYNSETCRYEPARISIVRIVSLVILFTITTALIFGGILVLHSQLFVSEKQKALKKENLVLTKHYASLQQGLSQVNGTLVSLNSQNSELHKKIFETPLDATSSSTPDKATASLLETDEAGFHNALNGLKSKFEDVSKTSMKNNAYFSTLDVSKKELLFLTNIPSSHPIENHALANLVSGFGTRIHPFHKGNYHHPGADFSAPRGTSIIATANGRVVDLKGSSSLQAGYGNYIEIDHGNGLITRYAHLDNISVRFGQKVLKGTVIGTVGMSGGAVAPHVHYEIIRKGEQVNPVPYVMENLSSAEYIALQKLGSIKNQSLD